MNSKRVNASLVAWLPIFLAVESAEEPSPSRLQPTPSCKFTARTIIFLRSEVRLCFRNLEWFGLGGYFGWIFGRLQPFFPTSLKIALTDRLEFTAAAVGDLICRSVAGI